MTSVAAARAGVIDEPQLRGVLAQVERRPGDSRMVVVVAEPVWHGPPVLDTAFGPVRIVTGHSVLAVRAAMVDHPDEFLVVLTPLDVSELGDEVRARAWSGAPRRPSPWDAVKALFKVASLDPSLRHERWMVDLLLQVAPARGYAQPASQVLDRDTAWRNLYQYGLGLPEDHRTVRGMLAWAATPAAADALARFDDTTRQRIADHLAVDIGPAARPLLQLVAEGHGHEALALGLAVDALWPHASEAARVRFQERHLHGTELDQVTARDWGDAAVAEVRALVGDDMAVDAIADALRRADEILTGIDPDATADSAVLERGFVTRLARLGRLLGAVLDGESRELQLAATALDDLRAHLRAGREAARVSRAEAALRLCRRAVLGGDVGAGSGGLAAQAARYIAEGGWVDAARHRIAEGETVPELVAVFDRLLSRIDEERRDRDRAFAAAIAAEAARPRSGATELRTDRPLPIEDVLSAVVAPLATTAPVLVLVIDGLSHAAAVPLEGDLRGQGWTPLGPDGAALPPVVAALPTVTVVSRASLLSGRLTTGGPDVEREGFATCRALLDAADGQAPVLFHKSDLGTSGGEIAPRVRDAVTDPAQRVVGVVVNAVDDHLDKGGQLRLADGLEGIPVLGPILKAAAEAQRVVVLTSDHGHILGAEQQYVPAPGGGERFRVSETPPAGNEVEITGGRVLRGDGRIVAAAEDTVRYIPTAKHGYHGGVTPAEALCPLLVLAHGQRRPTGWEPLAPRAPRWWEPALAPVDVEPVEVHTTAVPREPQRTAEPEPTGPVQPSLLEPPAQPPPTAAAQPAAPQWLTTLLASPRLRDQRRLAGRMALPDDELARLLQVLMSSEGTASGAALQRSLGLSPSRLRGKLEAARALLNVDGYRVLTIEADGTARLDVELLAQQFEIPSLGGGARS